MKAQTIAVLVICSVFVALIVSLAISIRVAVVRADRIDALTASLAEAEARAERQDALCNATIESLKHVQERAQEVQHEAQIVISQSPEWASAPVPDGVRSLCASLCDGSAGSAGVSAGAVQ